MEKTKIDTSTEPFEKIKSLTNLNLQIFEIIDKLKAYDVGLAPMELKNATISISRGMANIADEISSKKNGEN